jgi:large subunit ribosomal protein L21
MAQEKTITGGSKPLVPTIEKYVIFQTGGKQYQAIPGKTVAVEKLDGNVGDTVEIPKVLFRKTGEKEFEIGRPYIQGAVLKASIVKQARAPKIIVFRRKRRKKSRVKKGHRQPLTVIRIESI